MMNAMGKLQRVALRNLWGSEPNDFTPWLEENIDELSDTIDLPISIVEREHKPTDRLSVDLLGETETGDRVVIENQLEKSDHEHLGKVMTYLVTSEAEVGIWIVADPKPEHVKVISWLNEMSSADFYLVKLEAVQIDESLPAPLLTLIVGASEESKEVGEEKKEDLERYNLRRQFWAGLLDRAKEKTPLHDNIGTSKHTSIYATVKGGIYLQYTIRQHDSEVALYTKNSEVFRALEEKKEEIEEAFGEELKWIEREGTLARRIFKSLSDGGYRNEEGDWAEIQEAMIDAMIQLNNALEPHIEAF